MRAIGGKSTRCKVSNVILMTSDVHAAKVKGSKMKMKNKPLRRKIVVALLGMCVAVSSYTISASETSATQEQAAAGVQGGPGTTNLQSTPTHPQNPFQYGYTYYGYTYYGYGYTYYGYTYYGYNQPYGGDSGF
jgi:hypothetical protein